jgi:hypothetical protein
VCFFFEVEQPRLAVPRDHDATRAHFERIHREAGTRWLAVIEHERERLTASADHRVPQPHPSLHAGHQPPVLRSVLSAGELQNFAASSSPTTGLTAEDAVTGTPRKSIDVTTVSDSSLNKHETMGTGFVGSLGSNGVEHLKINVTRNSPDNSHGNSTKIDKDFANTNPFSPSYSDTVSNAAAAAAAAKTSSTNPFDVDDGDDNSTNPFANDDDIEVIKMSNVNTNPFEDDNENDASGVADSKASVECNGAAVINTNTVADSEQVANAAADSKLGSGLDSNEHDDGVDIYSRFTAEDSRDSDMEDSLVWRSTAGHVTSADYGE